MNLSFFSGGAAWRQEGKGDPLNEVRPVRGHVFLVFIFWFDEEHLEASAPQIAHGCCQERFYF